MNLGRTPLVLHLLIKRAASSVHVFALQICTLRDVPSFSHSDQSHLHRHKPNTDFIAMSLKERWNVKEEARTFTSKDMDTLQRSDQRQKQLRETVKLARRFTKEERSALEIESMEAFGDFWQAAMGGKITFDANHEHGVGRVSKRANSLSASAYFFLQDMSPMVEIVKNLGAPYGNMAIGTICFVFAVSKNRVRMEEQINSTFLSIQDRLPSIRMYQHVYNEKNELQTLLQSKIVDAYDGFISFCIAALEFYAVPSYRRILWALKGTSRLEEKAARVQKSIVDMRLACEDLLNQNVNIVKTRLEEVRNQNIELQNDRDFNNLETIRGLLRIEAFSPEALLTQFRTHQSNLAAEFRSGSLSSDMTPRERLGMVRNDTEYKEWLDSQRSGMFILSGQNCFIGATHCWVSPVALDLIEKFVWEPQTDSNPDPCVFYLFGHRDTDETCSEVLSLLIFELLSMNKEALRHGQEFCELWAELRSYAQLAQSRDAPQYEVQQGPYKVALRAIDLFGPNRTIWIVLDRVDKCRLAPGQRGSQHRGGRMLLQTMVHLVEQAVPRVKVLAVVNRADWHVEDQVDELGQQREESVMIQTFHE
ncbi:hypothetical protein BGZ63DRAFT_247756 [Mariannaea sp. PMI_226]|nr:hypothetical protein BGZ63DRAFT_247756 [Mariannaea sp. PMI_226]